MQYLLVIKYVLLFNLLRLTFILSCRFETCYQIALAIKKEVEDLEAGGIKVSTCTFCSDFIKRSIYSNTVHIAHVTLLLSIAGHPN
jgi:hypothetical protein